MKLRPSLALALLAAVAAFAVVRWKRETASTPAAAPAPAEYAEAAGAVPIRPLAADVHIAGVVRGPSGPFEGASVRLYPDGEEDGQPETVIDSGDGGAFDLGWVRSRRWAVIAEAPGMVPARIEVPIGAVADELELTLARCVHHTSGVVVDAAGAPVARARVSVPRVADAPVLTDAAGRFRLCARERAWLRVEAEGFLAGFEIPWGTASIPLTRAATIVGRVVDEAGAPVSGEYLHLGYSWTPIAGDGRFRFGGLAAGAYTIEHRDWGLSPSSITVRTGETVEVTLRATPRFIVRGRLVADGKPTHGGLTFPGAGQGVYSSDGRFSARVGPRGEYPVVVTGRQVIAPKSVVLAPDMPELVIELEPLPPQPPTPKSVILRGRVTRLGTPVVGAEVRDLSTEWAVTTTGDDGSYALFVSAGTRRIEAYSRDLAACSATVPFVVAEGQPNRLDLELEHGASVSGVVVGLDGAPVRWVRVGLMRQGTGERASIRTLADGTFFIAPLVPGVYDVTASSENPWPANLVARTEIPVARSDSAVNGIRLVVDNRTGGITGTVDTSDGRAAAGARVLVPGFEDFAGVGKTTVGPDGRFSLSRLPLGKYTIEVTLDEVGTVSTTAAVTGPDLSLTIPAPAVVEGTVTGLGTAPTVTIEPTAGARRTAIATGGTFRIEGVPTGDALVRAEGTQLGDVQRIHVAAGSNSVALRAGGAARVVVRPRDERGHPIDRLACKAFRVSWPAPPAPSWVVDPRAPALTLDVAADGMVEIRCTAAGGRYGSAYAATAAGQTVEVGVPIY